jgi:hypothetical protein
MLLVQQARNITAAAKEVQACLESGDMLALAVALESVEEHFLPELLVCKARAGLALDAAAKSGDAEALEDALRAAKAAGVAGALLDKAHQELAEQRHKNAVKELEIAMQSDDIDAIENAMRAAGELGVSVSVLGKFKQRLEESRSRLEELKRVEDEKQRRDQFLAGLQTVQRDNITAMRALIQDGEQLGFTQELEPIREAIEEELSRRMAKAKADRAKYEKLAAEFKDANDAQVFGGVVLVAQWRAAVAEISKPLEISED